MRRQAVTASVHARCQLYGAAASPYESILHVTRHASLTPAVKRCSFMSAEKVRFIRYIRYRSITDGIALRLFDHEYERLTSAAARYYAIHDAHTPDATFPCRYEPTSSLSEVYIQHCLYAACLFHARIHYFATRMSPLASPARPESVIHTLLFATHLPVYASHSSVSCVQVPLRHACCHLRCHLIMPRQFIAVFVVSCLSS